MHFPHEMNCYEYLNGVSVGTVFNIGVEAATVKKSAIVNSNRMIRMISLAYIQACIHSGASIQYNTIKAMNLAKREQITNTENN